MQLIPAIDLLDGGCVRLRHGDFNERTDYEADPLDLAREYSEQGAGWLHVVDLAAARDGEGVVSAALGRVLGDAPLAVQTGGGVREADDVRQRLDQGAKRVVVGSACAQRPEAFVEWLRRFGADRVVAGLDVQLDRADTPWPRIHGWTEGADRTLWSLLDFLTQQGLQHLLCTDIGRDGALAGPNLDLYRRILRRYPDLRVQASGGVASIDDLRRLKRTGVAGAITGKALLDGHFTVAEALDALS